MSLWVCNVKVISIAEAAMEITSTLQAYDDISIGLQWKLLTIFVIIWKNAINIIYNITLCTM